MATILDPGILNHVKNYLGAVKTGKDIDVSTLIDTYLGMNSALHQLAQADTIDVDALSYALGRLPDEIFTVAKVLMVESYADIKSVGFDITKWNVTISPARRRLTYINSSKTTIASMLSSESDIHDLVNCLICLVIEKKKIHRLLNGNQQKLVATDDCRMLNLDESLWQKLKQILGKNWADKILSTSYDTPIIVHLYGHTDPLYIANCQKWVDNLINHSFVLGLNQAPAYFVSSNSHSLTNIIGGFVSLKQNYILDFISQHNPALYNEWFKIRQSLSISRVNDFIFYTAGAFLRHNPQVLQEKLDYEQTLGIRYIPSTEAFQSDSQIIPLKSFALSKQVDSNLHHDPEKFANNLGCIINIQYPLGYAAYYLLSEIFKTFTDLRGIYIMGKAAIITGSIGDIQIPSLVFDESTNNIYHFNNLFNNDTHFQNNISQVHLNQKAACVYGTYLENKTMVGNYLSAGFNIIEMENGPYLRAITEKYLLGHQEIALDSQYDLSHLPLELGIINYASDNPLGANLTKETTSLFGVEPVYLASLAVLQRIIDLEQSAASP